MRIKLFIFLLSAPLFSFAQTSEINFIHNNINFSSPPRTSVNPMSIKLWDNYQNGGPTTYGTVLEIYGLTNHQTSQLYFGGWDNSKIKYREAFYGENTWSEWITMLDSKNNVQSQGNLVISGAGDNFITGRLGIGVTTPINKFQVNSNNIGTGAFDWIAGNFGGLVGNRVVMGILGGTATIGGHNNTLSAWANIAINPDGGNVGIGTVNPTSKLSVNGGIRAREIKVEVTNWPDFVFAKEYYLPSLNTIENYIKTNGHLPNIPSSSEIELNGLDLGEMNKKLLQKVEELTLHLIELKKKSDERDKKFQAQLDLIIKNNGK